MYRIVFNRTAQILFVLLFSTSMHAQTKATIKKSAFPGSTILSGTNNAADADEKLAIFRQNHKLTGFGGWKWLGRTIDEYGQRTNPDGSLPNAHEYFTILENARKSQLATRGSGGNGWYPLGPFDKPMGAGFLNNYGIGRANCIAFHPTNNAVWYAGFGQAGLWKTSDTGKTWTEMDNGLPILRISDIAIDPVNPNTMYACLGDFEYSGVSLWSVDRKRNTHFGMGVYKSTNGGQNWLPTGLSAAETDFDGSLFRRVIINPKNSNELVAAGISGIYKSANAGASWSKINGGSFGDLEMVEKNSNVLYASGRWLEFYNSGSVKTYKSYDFGSTWIELTVPWPATGAVNRVELALAPTDTGFVYAVCAGQNWGDLYGLYLSTNGGKTWNKQYNLKYNLLSNTPYDSSSVGYSQGDYDLALCVNPADNKKLYLGGIQTLFSNDGGKNFEMVYSSVNHVDEHQFKIHPKLNTWVLCNDGGIYSMPAIPKTTGFNLALMDSFVESPCNFRAKGMNIGSYYRLGFSPHDTDLFVGGAQDNGSVIGNNWQFTSGGDGMDCSIFGDDWITSAQYGSFFHFQSGFYDGAFNAGNSKDGFGEWTTPMYPSYSYDTSFQTYTMNDVFVLYDQLVSVTFGWSDLSAFSSTRVGTAMDISNPDTGRVYIAKKPKLSDKTPIEVWTNIMGKNNWKNITAGLPDSLYVTDFATNPNNGLQAWITFSGFTAGQKIYYTKNAGKNWTNISYNLPNIPVNTVIFDSQDTSHGIYIGTDVGVYYINDKTNLWKSFSTNLPNVIVSDLDINKTNHTLYCSTFGRAMWACTLPKVNKQNAVSKIGKEPIKITNPVHGDMQVLFPSNARYNCHFDMLNQSGQAVKKGMVSSSEHTIHCADLKNGIYYLRIAENGEMLMVEKVLVE